MQEGGGIRFVPYVIENSFYQERFGALSASTCWSPVTALGAPGDPADPKKSKSALRATEKALPNLDPDFHVVVPNIHVSKSQIFCK